MTGMTFRNTQLAVLMVAIAFAMTGRIALATSGSGGEGEAVDCPEPPAFGGPPFQGTIHLKDRSGPAALVTTPGGQLLPQFGSNCKLQLNADPEDMPRFFDVVLNLNSGQTVETLGPNDIRGICIDLGNLRFQVSSRTDRCPGFGTFNTIIQVLGARNIQVLIEGDPNTGAPGTISVDIIGMPHIR